MNTPTILAIIQNQTEFRIISLENTSLQISQTVLNGVVKVFCSGTSMQNSTSYSFDGGYFSQDILQQFTVVSNTKFINFGANFTTGLLPLIQENVQKVI